MHSCHEAHHVISLNKQVVFVGELARHNTDSDYAVVKLNNVTHLSELVENWNMEVLSDIHCTVCVCVCVCVWGGGCGCVWVCVYLNGISNNFNSAFYFYNYKQGTGMFMKWLCCKLATCTHPSLLSHCRWIITQHACTRDKVIGLCVCCCHHCQHENHHFGKSRHLSDS